MPKGLDVSVPNVARMYDYFLGGKDNFEADRIAAEEVLALMPGQRATRRERKRKLASEPRFVRNN